MQVLDNPLKQTGSICLFLFIFLIAHWRQAMHHYQEPLGQMHPHVNTNTAIW